MKAVLIIELTNRLFYPSVSVEIDQTIRYHPPLIKTNLIANNIRIVMRVIEKNHIYTLRCKGIKRLKGKNKDQ